MDVPFLPKNLFLFDKLFFADLLYFLLSIRKSERYGMEELRKLAGSVRNVYYLIAVTVHCENIILNKDSNSLWTCLRNRVYVRALQYNRPYDKL